MANKQFVNKDTYQTWEATVIKLFFNSSKRPKNLDITQIFAATKQKVIIVLIPHMSHPISDIVETNRHIYLPNKTKIDMYHIGKGDIDQVSYGLEDDTFYYPACDVGGLTNYRHQLGTKPNFVLDEHIIYDPYNDSQHNPLYEQWLELSGHDSFTDDVKDGFKQWLHSLYHLPFAKMRLNFVVLPPELRIIVKPDLVKEKTGAYYIRVYGQGNEHYAQISDGNGLWCGVSESYITPNLNIKNLQNEYV